MGEGENFWASESEAVAASRGKPQGQRSGRWRSLLPVWRDLRGYWNNKDEHLTGNTAWVGSPRGSGPDIVRIYNKLCGLRVKKQNSHSVLNLNLIIFAAETKHEHHVFSVFLNYIYYIRLLIIFILSSLLVSCCWDFLWCLLICCDVVMTWWSRKTARWKRRSGHPF